MSRAAIRYKVVEVSPVAEETLEKTLNERVAEGWGVESVHFVMREGPCSGGLSGVRFQSGIEE